VSVATTDNRVGPGHARKLAHRLMDVGAPVHFLEPDGGGHGVSDPLQRPDMMTKRATFLIDALMPAPAARRP
jgi:prolyl oligopeptidase